MDADARVKRQVEYSEACQVDIYTVTRNVGPVCIASYRIVSGRIRGYGSLSQVACLKSEA